MSNNPPDGPQYVPASRQPVPGAGQPPLYDNPYQRPVAPPQAYLPSLASTIWITALFGVLFGWIPALIHTNRARDMGVRTSRYWKAFAYTGAASFFVWFLIIMAAGCAANSAVNNYNNNVNAYESALANQPAAAPTYQPQDGPPDTGAPGAEPASWDSANLDSCSVSATGDLVGTVTITNRGTDAAAYVAHVQFTYNGYPSAAGSQVWTYDLAPGASTTISYDNDTMGGTYGQTCGGNIDWVYRIPL